MGAAIRHIADPAKSKTKPHCGKTFLVHDAASVEHRMGEKPRRHQEYSWPRCHFHERGHGMLVTPQGHAEKAWTVDFRIFFESSRLHDTATRRVS
jgi:hypothetical protein